MKYIAAGNIMSDIIEQPDGSHSRLHIGGPALFALSGIRLFTDEVALCSNVGADFDMLYGQWMKQNNLSSQAVKVKAEHCSLHILRYLENGAFEHQSVYGGQNLGYLKTTPEELEAALNNTRGVYMAQNTDRVFWDKLTKIKEKHSFRFMLEMEINSGLARVKDVCQLVDYFSLNINEAADLLGIPRENEEDIINELLKFPVKDIFFRVGAKGSYALRGNTGWFVPSVNLAPPVDPTGCGNCSTGCAMFAYTEGYDPIMTAIMANIAAAYNVMQYGPYPHYTAETRQQALALAQKMRQEYPPLN